MNDIRYKAGTVECASTFTDKKTGKLMLKRTKMVNGQEINLSVSSIANSEEEKEEEKRQSADGWVKGPTHSTPIVTSDEEEGADDPMGEINPFDKKAAGRPSVHSRLGSQPSPAVQTSHPISESKTTSASQPTASSNVRSPEISKKKPTPSDQKGKKRKMKKKKEVTVAKKAKNVVEWKDKVAQRLEAETNIVTLSISKLCKNPSKPSWEEIKGEFEGAGFWNKELINYGLKRKIGSCFKFFKSHREDLERKVRYLEDKLTVSERTVEVMKNREVASKVELDGVKTNMEGYISVAKTSSDRAEFLRKENEALSADNARLRALLDKKLSGAADRPDSGDLLASD
jgi:hypothetical protein